MKMNINFGKIMQDIMTASNLNQMEVSEMLGVRQSQVSNWINGKSLPGYYSIKMICEKLKVSADFLLEINDNN
ncbi:MAG: helix-turn-helix domain-containing protein [Firmicutes bacterium]|nr:helix-turn-helix domain-containing protein [Bacillota bacterium]